MKYISLTYRHNGEKEVNMSKKEVLCNLTESDMNNLNTAIECIKVNQQALLKGTIEQTNAIAVTVTNIYEIVSNDRGSMIKLSKETGLNKGTVSKMYTAVTLMLNNDISFDVSYNKVYKVKDVIENNPTRIDEIKNDLITLSVNEILSKYALNDCDDSEGIEDTDTSENTDTDTKANKKEIIDNILYTLSIYDISKEDLQTINKLLACL